MNTSVNAHSCNFVYKQYSLLVKETKLSIWRKLVYEIKHCSCHEQCCYFIYKLSMQVFTKWLSLDSYIFLITERDDGFENFYAKKHGMCSSYFSYIWINKYQEVLLQSAVQWSFFFTWYDNECNILRDTISDVNSLKRRLIQTIFDWYIFFGWNIYRQENKYLWRWLGQWLESTAVWPKTQRYLHVALTVRKWNSHLCLY